MCLDFDKLKEVHNFISIKAFSIEVRNYILSVSRMHQFLVKCQVVKRLGHVDFWLMAVLMCVGGGWLHHFYVITRQHVLQSVIKTVVLS